MRSLLLLCGIAVMTLSRVGFVSYECPDLPAPGDFLLFFVLPIVTMQPAIACPHMPPRMADLHL